MENPDFTTEPVIGHHVAAKRQERSTLQRQVDRLMDNHNMSRDNTEHIVIEVGDVDWDSTKTIRLQKETLLEIADYYR